MTFWQIFVHLLPLRPRRALVALYWHLTRRRVRARNQLLAASTDLPFAYRIWIDRNERVPEVVRNATQMIDRWRFLPKFDILLHGNMPSPEALQDSVRSVSSQAYPHWVLNDAVERPLEDRIASSVADFIIPLRVGDRLSELALFRYAEALQMQPTSAILYGDQDELDRKDQRRHPWFKPEWNEEMFLAQDYLTSAVAIDGEVARSFRASDFASLVLEATSEVGDRITHIPHVLCHVRNADTVNTAEERRPALQRLVEKHGGQSNPGPFGTSKINWPLPTKLPLVSIIIPTKDRVDLLKPCVESVLDRTSYANFEILIVDNQSTEPETAAYFDELARHPNVKVLPYPHPYNFSAINNFAVRSARGEFLCLLNNDTEVVEADWLTEMMRYGVKRTVGAVGAKLLYEDGSIQHAGVVIGIGEAAGHAHRFLPRGDLGYFRMVHVTHYVSAVTAACLVVAKEKFIAVGGLDEENFAVAFNDVDFCLKLEAAGWRNVYVPHAVLIHHESKSRGNDIAPENFRRYSGELRSLQERWNTKTYRDPLHNPNLDRSSEIFAVNL